MNSIKTVLMKQPFVIYSVFAAMMLGSMSACKNESARQERAESVAPSKEALNLVVDFTDTGVKIQPTMYGIFFEDINFAADGGLYAEMVKNRSFEFLNPKMGWKEPNSNTHSYNIESGFLSPIKYTGENTNHT